MANPKHLKVKLSAINNYVGPVDYNSNCLSQTGMNALEYGIKKKKSQNLATDGPSVKLLDSFLLV